MKRLLNDSANLLHPPVEFKAGGCHSRGTFASQVRSVELPFTKDRLVKIQHFRAPQPCAPIQTGVSAPANQYKS
jgi:hypothetical protein